MVRALLFFYNPMYCKSWTTFGRIQECGVFFCMIRKGGITWYCLFFLWACCLFCFFAESFEKPLKNPAGFSLQGNLRLHSRTHMVIENALSNDCLTCNVLEKMTRCRNSAKQLILEFWDNWLLCEAPWYIHLVTCFIEGAAALYVGEGNGGHLWMH